ncbi:MAG: ATP-binding protein [Lachnospiraceae bacterium]|uniref:ATP-binding protein n=1 Tax=Roseburia hominis TaxID=301301 RepID=UPI001F16074E|nr:ATP-binding protein [Roseburia hominis]MDD6169961.1 ATP-binding protein [Lachnospiraceae bacterium]MDY4840334.1 ATP-binding protein [Lachnospiraceae bacterium]
MKRAEDLILYKNFKNGKLFYDFSYILENYEKKEETEKLRKMFYECFHELVELAGSHGFSGNLWHNFLTFLLINNENAYSTACEKKGNVGGSMEKIALHDITIFKALFDFDLDVLTDALTVDGIDIIKNYDSGNSNSKVLNQRIRDRIVTMSGQLEQAENETEFLQYVTEFYKEFGVGTLGLHKAFRIEHDANGEAIIAPISRIAHVKLEDLVGYESAKKKLIDNTKAFVEGKQANNCLLFGDAGTGKSSSIKAIINEYYEDGLRMIEVYKHQFQDLNAVIAQIKNRNYKFIIYMDDLSFEEFEIEYKYLKAVIEGGLEKKPDNVLIYATSNRRHLVRETFSDRAENEDDLHNNDTIQEKLSLVARFGVSIYFGAPTPKEFKEIVKVLAKKQHVMLDEDTLLAEANKWELSHGGLSGRTAQQFINYLLGQQEC